jgi:hypothetical protein
MCSAPTIDELAGSNTKRLLWVSPEHGRNLVKAVLHVRKRPHRRILGKILLEKAVRAIKRAIAAEAHDHVIATHQAARPRGTGLQKPSATALEYQTMLPRREILAHLAPWSIEDVDALRLDQSQHALGEH